MIDGLVLLTLVGVMIAAVFIGAVSLAMPITNLYPRHRQVAGAASAISLFLLAAGFLIARLGA